MKPRRSKNTLRRIATFAALILLLGQAIAAAHFHSSTTRHELAAGGSAGIADSSCALCAAHFHSPATFAVGPALNAPAIARKQIASVVLCGLPTARVSNCFGRAPPASI